MRDDYGDVTMTVSAKRCPVCDRQLVQRRRQPSVPVELITAVREAKLRPDELLELADELRATPDGLSPRDVAARVPAASSFVTIASRLGDNWVELLATVVMIVCTYITAADAERAHQDAVQAHKDAEVAHQDAERAHQDSVRALRDTSQLSDEEIRKLAEQVESEVGKRNPK